MSYPMQTHLFLPPTLFSFLISYTLPCTPHTPKHNHMASEQLARRENTTTEREIHLEKDKVPKMTTHFEHLAEQAQDSDNTGGKDTPQGSMEAFQGGERVQEHAGKAIGDVGGRGKAKDNHELGAHFESLANKVKDEDHKEKLSDHAANVCGNKESSDGATREREECRKLEMGIEGGEVRGRTENERGRESRGQVVAERGRGTEEKLSGRDVGAGNEGASATTVITCTLEKGDNTQKPIREESESERSRSEQISNYTGQATQNEKERYERAKQAASETLNNTAQTAIQAKDATLEKGQQGYAATKDTISGAAKTASEKTAPVAEKAKEYSLQAAEKAKSAGGTTTSHVAQAKDVTVESGKSAAGYAAKVASDLKDKAAAVGWAAAHFSTEKTVEGTKAAAHVVEGAAGYAGQKAFQLASKSAGAFKGLAASAGETAKEYTARKKEEARRELEAKTASQPQEVEERPSEGIGENVSQCAQKMKAGGGSSQQEGTGSTVLTAIGETVSSVGKKVTKPFVNIMGGEGKKGESGGGGEDEKREESGGGQDEGKGVISQTLTSIGEKLGDAKQREELLDNITGNITEGGGEVLGAVSETLAEIGENITRPAERVQEYGQVEQRGGVLGAIGETIAEIAETTKVMVAGRDDGELRLRKGHVSDPATHEGSQSV